MQFLTKSDCAVLKISSSFLISRLYKLILAPAIFFLVLLLFWPGVSGGFLFDDFHNIVTNSNVQIKELNAANLWAASQGYSGGTRQLAMVSFALNAYWAGLDPWAYKVTGLVVHALNAVLVFLLAQRLVSFSPRIVAQHQRMAALALALVWALHPIQVSSALYVVQRMETLCTTFLLVALLLYLRARVQQINVGSSHPGLWLGMCSAAVLAVFFKESAVLLPLFCLGLEVTVLRFASVLRGQQQFWRLLYLVGSVLALLVFLFLVVPHYYSAEPYAGRDFNTIERLLTQARVLWLYVQQMLLPLPHTLYFYYDDLHLSTGWLQPVSTLPAVLGWLLVLGLAVCWRQRFPLFAIGIFWFFAAHFLTSNVIGLEMVFEHRNYFALLGILLICAEVIARLPVRDGPAIKYVGVSVLVIGIAFLGSVRAATWGNVLLLATDMTQANPKSARAGMDMGVAYYELSGGDNNSPFYQFAAREFERVSAFPHASTQPMVNLILMSASGDLPHDMLDVDAVWQRYLLRLEDLHLSVETRTSVWSLLEQRMKGKAISDQYLPRALEVIFARAEQDDYRYAQAADYYFNLLHEPDLAISHYKTALQKAASKGNTQLINAIVDELAKNGLFKLVIPDAQQPATN